MDNLVDETFPIYIDYGSPIIRVYGGDLTLLWVENGLLSSVTPLPALYHLNIVIDHIGRS